MSDASLFVNNFNLFSTETFLKNTWNEQPWQKIKLCYYIIIIYYII